MADKPLSLPGDSPEEFGRSFLIVLCAHILVVSMVWIGGRSFFKQPAPEPITWLDGGGELGSAALLALPEDGGATPPPPVPEPEPEVLPPLPPEPQPAPTEPSEIPVEAKPTPTPSQRPKPTPTPAATPRRKSVTPTPKPKKSTRATPTPSKKATPVIDVVKAQPSRPVAKPPVANTPNPSMKPIGADPGTGNAPSGGGDATNPGTKGGPGAPGGTNAVLLSYFKKVEAQFHRVWEQPLTAVRSGRDVEAHVKLRAAADGVVESLKLVKPTGNHEVDQSIVRALQQVTRVEPPPAELLKKGALDEMVVFILEL